MRAGRRASYDLALTRAVASIGERSALIGNAAQALHPVAGQGFNLGLRDGAMLAELIAADCEDAGGAALLRQFSDWRARDRRGVIRFTDGLVKLFGDGRRGVGVLRNLGLLLFDLLPPAKSALARVSAGFGGPTPRLARGLGLRGLRTRWLRNLTSSWSAAARSAPARRRCWQRAARQRAQRLTVAVLEREPPALARARCRRLICAWRRFRARASAFSSAAGAWPAIARHAHQPL